MVEIIPYQERWPEEFAAMAAGIRRAVGSTALRIDHIGSTSVPGLAAKDILDVMLTLADLSHSEELADALRPLGFVFRPEFRKDHPPAGLNWSAADGEKRYFHRETPRRVHLHVRAAGRANQRYALLFRDYLRAAPLAAAGYAELKRRLALEVGQGADHSAYVEIKDPVCDIIMAGAEAWAAQTGWSPGPSDA